MRLLILVDALQLGPVADRLHGRSLPGFHASSASVTRLDQRGHRTLAYQFRLDGRNGEAAPRHRPVDVGTDARRGDFLNWESTAPISVPGRSSVEVGILSSKPPRPLRSFLDPCLSGPPRLKAVGSSRVRRTWWRAVGACRALPA